jgi:hypothetical protein
VRGKSVRDTLVRLSKAETIVDSLEKNHERLEQSHY